MFIFPYKRNLLLTALGSILVSFLAYQPIKNSQVKDVPIGTDEARVRWEDPTHKEAWEKALSQIDEEMARLVNPCKEAWGTGEYKGFFGHHLFAIASDLSCQEALANCQMNSHINPGNSYYCTWNGRNIFSSAEMEVYRTSDRPCPFYDRKNSRDRSQLELGVFNRGSHF